MKLSAYGISDSDFVDFVARHKQTLRHLELDHCSLLRGSWYFVVASLKNFDHLELSHFSMKSCADKEHAQGIPYPILGNTLSVGSDVLLDYLYGTGFMPICSTDTLAMERLLPGRSIRSTAALERQLTEAASSFGARTQLSTEAEASAVRPAAATGGGEGSQQE